MAPIFLFRTNQKETCHTGALPSPLIPTAFSGGTETGTLFPASQGEAPGRNSADSGARSVMVTKFQTVHQG